jgi:hypothetical protein
MAEWPVLAKIAVAALILVIICAAVFFFVNTTLGATNNSAQKLSGVIADLDLKVFEPYNQKVVSGNRVLSALREFKDQDIAILLPSEGETAYGAFLCPAAWADGYIASPPEFGDYVGSPEGVFGDLNNEFYSTTGYLVADNGVLLPQYRNDNWSLLSNKGTWYYIPPSLRFWSTLIFDLNGSVIGIIFDSEVVNWLDGEFIF